MTQGDVWIVPERSPAGEANVLLMRTGGGGTLQMGVQWAGPPVDSVREARLEVATPGGWHAVATSTTQGFPPYTAVFHTSLSLEQAVIAASALNGVANQVRVVYEVVRTIESGAEVVVEGEVREAGGSAFVDLAWVEVAIAKGVLTLREEHWGPAGDAVLARAAAAAKDKAAMMIRALSPGEPSSVRCTVRLAEPAQGQESLTADIGPWFQKVKGRVLWAGSMVVQTPVTVRVRLGFEAKDTPIAFVQLRGEGQAALRGAVFSPVEVAPTGDGTVEVVAHFSTGQPPYSARLGVSSPELVLEPADVGLTLVEVDATDRKAAGMKSVTATVKYLREAETVDEWTVTFRYGDWSESWFVVTAGHPAEWEYQWKETPEEGDSIVHPPARTTEAKIRLKS